MSVRPPSVHKLVEHPSLHEVRERYGREAVVRAARAVIDALRSQTQTGASEVAIETLAEEVRTALSTRPLPFRSVLNATGVVLHTNLGRAPLGHALAAAIEAASGYCDLEMDLGDGKRASRLRDVDQLVAHLSGAEAGVVVNNNAAAVLLGVAALAKGASVGVSRGHLVEIGGGFRLPTILQASGSALLEVGTTNRTHLGDYEEAIDAGCGMLLLVHRSNFVQRGYVAEPESKEVVALAHRRAVPVVLDLGSGAMVALPGQLRGRELTVPEAVLQGFDAVCFSGDKLLGGPQAGFIVGRGDAVKECRSHPLARALRCDKLQLAAVLATLSLYQRGEAVRTVPVLRMLDVDEASLSARAQHWRQAIGSGEVVSCQDAIGGGSLPEAELEGFALAIEHPDPDRFLKTLRQQTPAVVAHIERDRVLLHPRTVDPAADDELIDGVQRALAACAELR